MSALRPKELLDYLLEDQTLTSQQLDEFIQANHKEGLHFEYKDGMITKQPNRDKGRQTIREYVSGFANSDGGVLLIGVSDSTPRHIAPCEPSIGGLPLEQWASRCLQGMVGYFSPQPRFQVIQHAQGPVLAVAVARAPSLVPCVESREQRHFLRIDDSTLAIPDYLHADLVLGRRQHPRLDVYDPSFTEESHVVEFGSPNERYGATRVFFTFMVENLSLIAAEQVVVGVVSWTLSGDDTKPHTEINRYLRSHMDIVERSSGNLKTHVVHKTGLPIVEQNLDPFTKYSTSHIGPFDFPSLDIGYWLYLLYVST